jgi:hypothetical protein
MIIYLDGLDEELVTGFAADVGQEFDEDYLRLTEMSSEPDLCRMARHMVSAVDSKVIHVWDGGWVRSALRGQPTDIFRAEWLLTRLTLGHGGQFLLLEDGGYGWEVLDFGRQWWHKILAGWDELGWYENLLNARRSALVGIHNFDTKTYLGPKDPVLTFVGDWVSEFAFAGGRPFYDTRSLEYFRPFGAVAIHKFGFASLHSVDKLPKSYLRRPVMVGPRAVYRHPELPSVPDVRVKPTPSLVAKFVAGVRRAAKRYNRRLQ